MKEVQIWPQKVNGIKAIINIHCLNYNLRSQSETYIPVHVLFDRNCLNFCFKLEYKM